MRHACLTCRFLLHRRCDEPCEFGVVTAWAGVDHFETCCSELSAERVDRAMVRRDFQGFSSPRIKLPKPGFFGLRRRNDGADEQLALVGEQRVNPLQGEVQLIVIQKMNDIEHEDGVWVLRQLGRQEIRGAALGC